MISPNQNINKLTPLRLILGGEILEVVDRWLEDNFDNEGTKGNYRSHLKTFSEFLKYEEKSRFGEYLEDVNVSDFYEDLVSFLDFLKTEKDFKPVTINHKMNTVKMFFAEHGIEVPEGDWKKLSRRKIPRSTPVTDDSMGTKEEWRKILGNMHLEGKSLLLFMLSSGCRLGEAVKLKTGDLDLESDPPEARVRAGYAKNEKPRTVYMTDEAGELIENWLDYREREGLKKKTRINLTEQEKEALSEKEQESRKISLRKRRGKFADSDEIWPIKKRTAYDIFNRALRKAGLEERDDETNRRKLHFHSARKFFKTNLKADDMNEDVVEYLLGHLSGIRGVYSKYEESDIPREKYKQHSHKLQILSPDSEVIGEIERISQENKKERWNDFKLILKSSGIADEKFRTFERKFERFQKLREVGAVSDIEDRDLEEVIGDVDLVTQRYNMAKEQFNLPEVSVPEDLDDDLFRALKEHIAELVSRNEPTQKVVKEEEVEDYLGDGWKFVNKLNDDKAIIEN